MKIETVKITKKDWERCHDFAERSVDTSINHYRRRKQGNREKIIQDIRTGKLGEIAAYRFLRRNGLYVREPDFAVYESRGKSWDADLTWRGHHFHCKSQTRCSVEKYGTSWILQYGGNGRGHTDKLFKHCTEQDFLVPCVVDDDRVTIYAVAPVSTLFTYELIKEPKIKWFADTKRAIYFEDLKDLPYYERWGKFRRLK